ncbi:MAG TPA: hypothetical protein VFH51_13870 [Myxococcota bacterium]|nr:hypothetical protein [Myxococcota bacterium]
MREVKALIVSAALFGFAAPAFAEAAHKDLAPSRPGATQVKKKKKDEKKEGQAGDPNATAPTPAPEPQH